jgi:Methyltransferase domain
VCGAQCTAIDLSTWIALIKSQLRDLAPAWQDRLRRLSRLRWLEKSRVARRYGASLRKNPVAIARYILLDPELGDFSYDLDNEGELVEFLAHIFDVDRVEVAGYVAEAHAAPTLTSELNARVRWRIDVKRPVKLSARVLWYAVARILKPRLIVETGIKHGLGSLVLLTALERNAEEGSAGRLISFDFDPCSGWMVPARLCSNWQPVFASTYDALDATLDGEEVDLFVCDTPPEYEIESFELHGAMRHAAPGIVLLSAGGDRNRALPELTAASGGVYHYFAERSRHPVFPGAGVGLAVDLPLAHER